MKKIHVILMSMLAVMLTSCSQDKEVKDLLGDYTYKVSGVVRVSDVGDVHLTPETGTMSITSAAQDKEVILSFNHSGGDVYDIRASVTADSIYLRSMHRYIEIDVEKDSTIFGGVRQHETYDVTVSGSGHMLSNGDVSFTLNYSGKELNDPSRTLKGQNIFLHCVRNAN